MDKISQAANGAEKKFNQIHTEVKSEAKNLKSEVESFWKGSDIPDRVMSALRTVEAQVKAKPVYYALGAACVGLGIGFALKAARRSEAKTKA